MVLVQNKYKNTLVGVLRTQITFVTHSSPSCYVTLRTQVIRLYSGNLGPQKTDSGVFIIMYSVHQPFLLINFFRLLERHTEVRSGFYVLHGLLRGGANVAYHVTVIYMHIERQRHLVSR